MAAVVLGLERPPLQAVIEWDLSACALCTIST